MFVALSLGIYAYRISKSARVLITWSTASELDAAGYNLYRSDQPTGEYVLINPQLIPASTDPWAGGEYSFVDTTAQPGITYYYLLEDVETDGQTNRHGPIEVKAQPGGRLEMILAIVLFVFSATGAILTYLPKKPSAAPKGTILSSERRR